MSNLVKRAALAARHWHGEQKRKYTGAPYWTHPAQVAAIVSGVPHTDEMLAAAWLHDVLEDTDCPANILRADFGEVVYDYVSRLTDTPKVIQGGFAKTLIRLNRAERKAIDRAHLRIAPPEVKTVKLADLIDNSGSIQKYDPDFAVTYLAEKRLLLDEALKGGDPSLWARADAIVREAERVT